MMQEHEMEKEMEKLKLRQCGDQGSEDDDYYTGFSSKMNFRLRESGWEH